MTLTGINIRFLYLICGAKYRGFSSVQVYPKSYCIQHKTKRYSFHSCRLMFIFSNADGPTAAGRFLRSTLCIESLRQRQAYSESCYISRKTKAAGLPPIPLDVYLFPKQTARLPQGVFSTRICTLNRSASVKPIRKAATFTQNKSGTVFTHTA